MYIFPGFRKYFNSQARDQSVHGDRTVAPVTPASPYPLGGMGQANRSRVPFVVKGNQSLCHGLCRNRGLIIDYHPVISSVQE